MMINAPEQIEITRGEQLQRSLTKTNVEQQDQPNE